MPYILLCCFRCMCFADEEGRQEDAALVGGVHDPLHWLLGASLSVSPVYIDV